MKKTPKESKLEEMLRSSKLVANGFMGTDLRGVSEIIEADAATLAKLQITRPQIAVRMQEITNIAKAALGNWITVDDKRIAKVDEAAKSIVVKVKKAEKAFVVDDKTKITKGKDSLAFADLKKDMNVSIEYKKEGDKMIATAIKVSAPKAAPKEKKAEEKPAKPAEAPKK